MLWIITALWPVVLRRHARLFRYTSKKYDTQFLTYKVLNGAAPWHLEPLIRLADMRGWRKLRSTKLLSIWWTAACVHPTSQAVIALDRPTSPVDGATTPSQHVWSSGFLRCGSDGMKLASTLTLEPCSETGGFISALKTHLFAVQRAN